MVETSARPCALAVISVTNDDATNLGVSLAVKQLSPQARTVTRVFDAELANKMEAAKCMDVVFGASMIAAPTFVAAACLPDVINAFVLDNLLFSIMDRSAGAEWEGYTPPQLRAEKQVLLLMRNRSEGQEYVPLAAETQLRGDERVLAVVWQTLS